ncbi:MAG: hypothetical protein M5U12_09410 [Verrucomicrobia bacterium]|nr:hypothetical protein [Verrucomicrobiota bacterium]
MNTEPAPSTNSTEHRLFFFQLGPVQEFIAQARSTRDLWSGSYLLSWMTGHLIHALLAEARSKKLGPVEIVFPRLEDEAGAMLRWIQAGGPTRDCDPEDVTLPTVPNRILAQVPAGFADTHAQALVNAVFEYRPDAARLPGSPSEWERICWACYHWFAAQRPSLFRKRRSWPKDADDPATLWHRQLSRFWQPTWLLWPAPVNGSNEHALFLQTPIGKNWHSQLPHQTPDPWMQRYHLALHRFDARRQTRGFVAWDGQAGLHKDSLSGKEEVIADTEWLEAIPQGKRAGTIP